MDATERFSNRVTDYARYRPHYPDSVIDCLRTNCQLSESSVVTDVGSGTGILTELFLRHRKRRIGSEWACIVSSDIVDPNLIVALIA